MESIIVTLCFFAILTVGIIAINDPEENLEHKKDRKKTKTDLESYNIDGTLDLDGNPLTTNELGCAFSICDSGSDSGSDSGGCDGGGGCD